MSTNLDRTTSATPLRGTQSLVGVMSFVFKHPSLTALELLWRWLAAIPLLFLAWHTLTPVFTTIPLNSTALESMTFLEPVRSVSILARQLTPFLPPLKQTGKWWIPLALFTWTLAATLGRTATLRRANRLWPRSHNVSSRPQRYPGSPASLLAGVASEVERPAVPSASAEGASLSYDLPQTALYTLLRALVFLLLIALWLYGLLAAVHATVTHPIAAGAEPNLVLLTACAVAVTLAAFLLWSTTVWLLDLRTVATITGTSQTTSAHLRSKLIETNLVLGIVRVILFVLAMTFSASPLPFQSRETQAYINVWWIGVAAFYILGSDFFHVVRRVTYLRLLQSISLQTNAKAPNAS